MRFHLVGHDTDTDGYQLHTIPGQGSGYQQHPDHTIPEDRTITATAEPLDLDTCPECGRIPNNGVEDDYGQRWCRDHQMGVDRCE